MSIKEQMKKADEIFILETEYNIIIKKIMALKIEISEDIKRYKEYICNKIKHDIINEGRSNNFEIQDNDTSWSMKYKNLKYIGDFRYDIKTIERINGSSYLKIEFVLETSKDIPNIIHSLTGPFKDQIEEKQKEIDVQKQIIYELENYRNNLDESSIILKYTLGEQRIIISSEVRGNKRNYMKTNMDELLKMIFD
jgi:hypothetical protein